MKKLSLFIFFLSTLCTAMEVGTLLFRQESKEEEEKEQVILSSGFPKKKEEARLKKFFNETQYAANIGFTLGLTPLDLKQITNIKKQMESSRVIEFYNGNEDQDPVLYYDLDPLVTTVLKNGYLERNAPKVLAQLWQNDTEWKKKAIQTMSENDDVVQQVKDRLCNDPDFLDSISEDERVKKNGCDSFLDAINEKKLNPKIKLSDSNEYMWRHITQHPDIYTGSRNFQPAHKRHFYISMCLVGFTCYFLGSNGYGKSFFEKTRDLALEFIQNRLKTPPQS